MIKLVLLKIFIIQDLSMKKYHHLFLNILNLNAFLEVNNGNNMRKTQMMNVQ